MSMKRKFQNRKFPISPLTTWPPELSNSLDFNWGVLSRVLLNKSRQNKGFFRLYALYQCSILQPTNCKIMIKMVLRLLSIYNNVFVMSHPCVSHSGALPRTPKLSSPQPDQCLRRVFYPWFMSKDTTVLVVYWRATDSERIWGVCICAALLLSSKLESVFTNIEFSASPCVQMNLFSWCRSGAFLGLPQIMELVGDHIIWNEKNLIHFCHRDFEKSSFKECESMNQANQLCANYEPKQILYQTENTKYLTIQGNAFVTFPGLDKPSVLNCVIYVHELAQSWLAAIAFWNSEVVSMPCLKIRTVLSKLGLVWSPKSYLMVWIPIYVLLFCSWCGLYEGALKSSNIMLKRLYGR